ncbi:kinase [Streptomyces sp. NPDC053367]|uniref:GHMP family kinase ATP-binding protein n=1 Tax=Streptomyces sp. NPDC053367 TaxID=3365700 RepID=UPI0037D4D30E
MAGDAVRRVGRGWAPVHHGEILQGAFPHEGRLVRALVTLPCTLHTTRATFTPEPGGRLTVSPPCRTKALRAARLALKACAGTDDDAGGHLTLTGDVPPGRGFGSSTSDVLAAVNAVQDALEVSLPTEETARMAVRAETASDALMFPDTTVLFAQREGEVLEDFGHALPTLRVLGFGSRPDLAGRGVDTLTLPPPHYTPSEIRTFTRLRSLLREAVATKDPALVGEVATASTLLNQRHLPVPALDTLLAIAEKTDALGLQTAHSGDIAGLLYDPGTDAPIREASDLLHALGLHEQWRFTTPGLPRGLPPERRCRRSPWQGAAAST